MPKAKENDGEGEKSMSRNHICVVKDDGWPENVKTELPGSKKKE